MNEIVLHRRLPHPLERVFRAVSEPAELKAWCPGDPGEVVESDPPRLIAWSANGHMVRFELQADGDGTWLTFTHLLPEGAPDQFAMGWEAYLARLDALLAGTSLGEQEAHDQRHLALGEGPELRLERRLFHPIDRLWRAITDASELAQWFPGEYEVVEMDPPRLLVARWHGETLRFELEADGPYAVLRFRHGFGERDVAARNAAGWERCFERLDALLRGCPMSEEDSLALWPFVHDRYADEFGVDPEIGRRAYAEHPAT